MATYRVPILGGQTNPDNTGNVYLFPYVNAASSPFWRHLFWNFGNVAQDCTLYGVFTVPKNYVGTATLVVVWTSTITSGNFGIEFGYRAVGGNDTESLNQGTAQETVNTTDVAPGATERRMEISLSLTSANFAADDTVEFYFARDDSADTIAGDVQVVDLFFQYADV